MTATLRLRVLQAALVFCLLGFGSATVHAQTVKKCFCRQQLIAPDDEFNPAGPWWYYGIYHEFDTTTGQCADLAVMQIDIDAFTDQLPEYCEEGDGKCGNCQIRFRPSPTAEAANATHSSIANPTGLGLPGLKRASDPLNFAHAGLKTVDSNPLYLYAKGKLQGESDYRHFKLFSVKILKSGRVVGWGFEIAEIEAAPHTPVMVFDLPNELKPAQRPGGAKIPGLYSAELGRQQFYVQVVGGGPTLKAPASTKNSANVPTTVPPRTKD